MSARGRKRCYCRRVLLGPGAEPVREQVGIGPHGPRAWDHTRVACGPVTPLQAHPERRADGVPRDGR